MFRDVESGRENYVDPNAARETDYLRRFATHASAIERSCVDLGIEYEPITTDRPLELVLFDLLKARWMRRPTARPPARYQDEEVLDELPPAILHSAAWPPLRRRSSFRQIRRSPQRRSSV